MPYAFRPVFIKNACRESKGKCNLHVEKYVGQYRDGEQEREQRSRIEKERKNAREKIEEKKKIGRI